MHSVLKSNSTDALYYKTLELQRKVESYFQYTKSTFSSDTRQSMKRRIIAKHLTNLNSQKRVENHVKGKSCAPFYLEHSLNISYRASNIPAHEFVYF